jgi:glycolate oxidase FAD binding subunit
VDEAVKKQLSDAGKISRSLEALDVTMLNGSSQEAIWNAIRELPRLMNQADSRAIACKASLPISRCLDVCDALERLAAQARMACAVSSHAGNGIAHLYLLTDNGIQQSAEVIAKARKLVSEMGGTLIVERMPSELKQHVDVWGPSRSDFQVMQAIKSQFDPKGTFSPGRFVGGI